MEKNIKNQDDRSGYKNIFETEEKYTKLRNELDQIAIEERKLDFQKSPSNIK